MFRVVVVAGVSLAACSSEDKTGTTDGGGQTSNPPGPFDAAGDAPKDSGAADAPTDAIEEFPAIK